MNNNTKERYRVNISTRRPQWKRGGSGYQHAKIIWGGETNTERERGRGRERVEPKCREAKVIRAVCGTAGGVTYESVQTEGKRTDTYFPYSHGMH